MGQTAAADIATIGRISAVPAMLQVIREMTGLRFAAVARVTEDSWTACAVLDQLGFGLQVGGELEVIDHPVPRNPSGPPRRGDRQGQ